MTSLSSYYSHGCYSHDCSTTTNNIPDPKLYDLEEIAVFYTHHVLCNKPPLKPSLWSRRRVPYQLDELHLRYAWENLSFQTIDTSIDDFHDGHGAVYKPLVPATHFSNNTETEQTYMFSVDRTTPCQVVTEIQRGLSIGEETRLVIPVPDEIRQETHEFGDEIRVTNINGDKIVRDIHWTGEHPVRLLPGSKATAEALVSERYLNIKFSAKIVISGRVKVLVTDAKDTNRLVMEVESDIGSLVKYYIDKASAGRTRGTCTWDLNNKSAMFPVQGSCFFQYAYEQRVKVTNQW